MSLADYTVNGTAFAERFLLLSTATLPGYGAWIGLKGMLWAAYIEQTKQIFHHFASLLPAGLCLEPAGRRDGPRRGGQLGTAPLTSGVCPYSKALSIALG